MKRREFLTAAAGTVLAATSPAQRAPAQVRNDVSLQNFKNISEQSLRIADGVRIFDKRKKSNTAPVLREEIPDNPGAVFIIIAGVDTMRDERGVWKPCPDQMERFGRRIGDLVFRKGDYKGGGTFIKPNMVGGFRGENALVRCHGGIVHPYLTIGLVDALHGMGNTNVLTGARGGMTNEQFIESGAKDLFDEHGLPLIEANIQPFKNYRRSELVRHKNPDGMVNRRFCTYKPAFTKGTTFINIAHAHTHKVGHTTLTIKNIQGVMPRGYGHICDSWTSMDIWRREFLKDFNRDYRIAVEKSYIEHGNRGYRFWDDGGFYRSYKAAGGYEAFDTVLKRFEKSRGDERDTAREALYAIADSRLFWAEQWAQRMMDVIEAIPAPYVNMVDGVFARGHSTGIMHTDFLTVGRSMVAVDAVTSWLMGHDPRELPYLRIANERGLGENDIERIPIYILSEKGVEKVRDYRTLKRHFLGIYNYGMSEPGPRFF